MRVLLFSHTTGYQLRAFNDAAETLGIELVFATDRCHRLDDPWQDRAVAVRFHDIEASVRAIVRRAHEAPADGVIAVGDRPVVLAAHAAAALGIPWHSVTGAAASADKRRCRAAHASAGRLAPGTSPDVAPSFVGRAASTESASMPVAPRPSPVAFPAVLKPLGLSGSRGVIRADDQRAFDAAFRRIAALLARPQIRAARAGLEGAILVEQYIPGREFALEGILTRGTLRTLAIFDKPDPLDGPFFEETIYVTPSRLPAPDQDRIAASVHRAAIALGLHHGPVHAECRVTPGGEIYVLEIAARPIGGLCSRVLTFTRAGTPGTLRTDSGSASTAAAASLEEVLLLHATGQNPDVVRERQAAAVMMIPIPHRGRLKGVTGDAEARAVPGVTDVRITAKVGQLLEPLPEAGSYLGFIFARGETPADVESAVRRAHARLDFHIAREVPVAREPIANRQR
jgi:biotin carboxylase